MRRLALALLAACNGAAHSPIAARAEGACPLGFDEYEAGAPREIAVARWSAAPPDGCPEAFDPVALLAPGGCVAPDCVTDEIAPGLRAALQIDGPSGSGRFESLGLAIDGAPPRFACRLGSTVGWRHLYRVGRELAPLPWLADLDGDGVAEVIVWDRLPWGGSEATNGMVPTVYALDGDRLVRHDERATAASAPVAAAYRHLASPPLARPGDPIACYRALADALDGWAARP